MTSSPDPMPLPQAAAGFTLIEIIVVLAILGLALALAAGYRPLQSSALSLEGAAAELASGLRLARSEAIADNRTTVFAVDVAAHRYRVGDLAPRALPPNLAIQLVSVAGERQAASVSGIRFNPDGSSTGGRITVAGANRRVAIGVDWLTGRVRIADVP